LAANATKVTVIYKPKRGPQFAVIFHVAGTVLDPNNAGIQAIVTALNSVTRAIAIEITLSASEAITASATSAAAYTSGDKGFFIFKDENQIAHNLKVPGIMASLVSADSESIDITSGAPKTFADAIVAHAKTPGDGDIVVAESARRSMNRKPIKGTGVQVIP
jgi:hypothetical protein